MMVVIEMVEEEMESGGWGIVRDGAVELREERGADCRGRK